MRILVVEDDLEAQRYLVQGLKESGHVVDEAADGDIGLNLALSRPYDVAIVDRMLPKMDGLRRGRRDARAWQHHAGAVSLRPVGSG